MEDHPLDRPEAEWPEGTKYTPGQHTKRAGALQDARAEQRKQALADRLRAAEEAFTAALEQADLSQETLHRIRSREVILGRDLEAAMGPELVALWKDRDYLRWTSREASERWSVQLQCPYGPHDTSGFSEMEQL